MKINKEKRIGRVLFIVEGGKYEFSLLKRIFCDLLGYQYFEKRRNRPEEFISGKDSYSKVAVVNTRESNIKDIIDHEEYLEEVFQLLLEQYQFPVDQSAIYYLFDRDPRSNQDPQRIETLITTLKNPYENEDNIKAGQLLLSYPSVESYIISGFKKDTYNKRFELGKDAKKYIVDENIQLNKLKNDNIEKAAGEFRKYLEEEGLKLDIDNFSKESLEIFRKEEKEYREKRGFRLFSMLTLAFLQMGIIEL